MAFRVRRRKGVNALRIGFKVIATLIALWASGYALNIVYEIMNSTCSPFYKGLKLVGLTVESAYCTDLAATNANTITGQSSTSLLAVIGIFAILWIVLEFVDVRF